ncbi:hypothetical protein [Erythrobacter sp. QSSC1-22B]|nr:hypothetical protein [Erythrobacter sp. QSSC1-22B]
MQHQFENALAGLAALLMVGTMMTAAVVIPPAHSPVQTDESALAIPALA